MSLLELRGVTMRFGGVTAIENLDLSVNAGEVFAVIGPNGAGKTTVFNVVTGIYDPSEGEVRLGGEPTRSPFLASTVTGFFAIALVTGIGLLLAVNLPELWEITVAANYQYRESFPWGKAAGDFFLRVREMPPRWTLLPFGIGAVLGAAGSAVLWFRYRRAPNAIAALGVARTFQNIRLFKGMTARDNVAAAMDAELRARIWDSALHLPRQRREERAARARADEILEFVGLLGDADRPAESLPYGHQRRLEIARALATRPRLLLLDEPAAGMNPSETRTLMTLIRRIRDRGVTVLLIEHDMQVVMGISDRIAVLNYGRKIAEGTPDEVRRDPGVIEAYLGADADVHEMATGTIHITSIEMARAMAASGEGS